MAKIIIGDKVINPDNTRNRDRTKRVTKLCLLCFKELDNSRKNSSKFCGMVRRSRWRRISELGYNEKQNERTKEYQRKVKEIVYETYGNKCACCGEVERLFLSIDHVNNDGSKEKSRNPYSIYLKIIRLSFPKDYQLLCMNCNHGKSRNKGICPHKLL